MEFIIGVAAPSTTSTAAILDNDPQIAVLAEQVKELKKTVNILIAQIQMLRSDVKNGNALVNKTFQ